MATPGGGAGFLKARSFAVPLRADVLLSYYYNMVLSGAAAFLAGYAISQTQVEARDTAAGEDAGRYCRA